MLIGISALLILLFWPQLVAGLLKLFKNFVVIITLTLVSFAIALGVVYIGIIWMWSWLGIHTANFATYVDTPAKLIAYFTVFFVYTSVGIVSSLNIVDQIRRFNFSEKNTQSNEDNFLMQFLKRKNRDNFITYVSLFLAFIGEYFLYKQTQETPILWMIILTAFLFLGIFVKQRILKYRVDHGLYGTSYSEAKEIVAFILEWYRENGDSNSKPPKLVFTQEEIDQCLEVNGGEEYAG